MEVCFREEWNGLSYGVADVTFEDLLFYQGKKDYEYRSGRLTLVYDCVCV